MWKTVQTLGIALFVFLPSLNPVLNAGSKKSRLYRQAQKPPVPEAFRDRDYADEIDREIARYFHGAQSRTDRSVVGRYSFSNKGRGNSPIRPRKNYTGGIIKSHRVRAGDTIYSISRHYGVEPSLILRQNPLLLKRPLYIGEEILVDRVKRKSVPYARVTRRYKVRRGDNLSRIARKYRVSVSTLRGWNRLRGSMIRAGQVLIVGRVKKKAVPRGYRVRQVFIKPIRGRITSGFGRRRNPFVRAFMNFHKGLDFGASLGTPFYAARSGVVISARRMGGYGNCIFIRHASGYVTVYAHGKKMLVKTGDVVKQGQQIGLVGRTGNATGPHLHFEVRRYRKAINPLYALKMKELIPRKMHLTLSMRSER